MKDLLLLVADADMLAFLGAILKRREALQIRPITYDIRRHPARDSGMIQSGAELVRMEKGRFRKAILLWDHHGSGLENKHAAAQAGELIQNKLDSYTWTDNSFAAAIDPELELWLWYSESSIRNCWNLTEQQLTQWVTEGAISLKGRHENAKETAPKELFEFIIKKKVKRTISPRDFELMGASASITALMHCEAFQAIIETLRRWFPPVT